MTWRTPEDGSVTTLKARSVGRSELGAGFVCVSDFVFDTTSRLANPAEEALKRKFDGTRRLHLNLFNIQSIAELGVDHPGLDLAPPDGSDRTNVVILPLPVPPERP